MCSKQALFDGKKNGLNGLHTAGEATEEKISLREVIYPN